VNKIIAIAAFASAAIAPHAVLAADTSQSGSALVATDAGTRFEIVDPVTGRAIAVLVPVATSPASLRIIGIVRAANVAPTALPAAAPEPLTPGQMQEQRQREIEAMFHVDHSS
jgi:hypothetical protein